MSYPHYQLIQPALDVLAELGKMLPNGRFIEIHVWQSGDVTFQIRGARAVFPNDLPIEDGTPYTTPDLIRMVQHVRRLEGLE